MTTNINTENAVKFYHAAQQTMSSLWERWQDEHEYEDIKDYSKPLQSIAASSGVTIVKMTKSPFGCVFTTDGKTFVLKMTSRAYEYKRIK